MKTSGNNFSLTGQLLTRSGQPIRTQPIKGNPLGLNVRVGNSLGEWKADLLDGVGRVVYRALPIQTPEGVTIEKALSYVTLDSSRVTVALNGWGIAVNTTERILSLFIGETRGLPGGGKDEPALTYGDRPEQRVKLKSMQLSPQLIENGQKLVSLAQESGRVTIVDLKTNKTVELRGIHYGHRPDSLTLLAASNSLIVTGLKNLHIRLKKDNFENCHELDLFNILFSDVKLRFSQTFAEGRKLRFIRISEDRYIIASFFKPDLKECVTIVLDTEEIKGEGSFSLRMITYDDLPESVMSSNKYVPRLETAFGSNRLATLVTCVELGFNILYYCNLDNEGVAVISINGLNESVSNVALQKKGPYFAMGTRKGNIFVVNRETKKTCSFKVGSELAALSFSADDKYLCTQTKESTDYWRLTDILELDSAENQLTFVRSSGKIKKISMPRETLKELDMTFDPITSGDYVSLSKKLKNGESVTLENGRRLTKEKLLVKAIAKNPHSSIAYYELGKATPERETCQLIDLRSMTQMQLFLSAIKLDPDSCPPYVALGKIVKPGSPATLHDGRRMDQQQLFLQAQALDPNFAEAYLLLGGTLQRGGNIPLKSGETFSQQQLYLKAVTLDPNNAEGYLALSSTLRPNEPIRIGNSIEMTKQQLLKRAIALNPHLAAAYTKLAEITGPGKTVTLEDSTEWSQYQLLIKAIALDSNHYYPYFYLATLLKRGDRVSLENGDIVSPFQLLEKAIALNPHFALAYYSLGTIMPDGSEITIGSESYTKDKLFLMAIVLDPANASFYVRLGDTLDTGEKVTLGRGEEMDDIALYKRSIALNSNNGRGYARLLCSSSEQMFTLNNGQTVDRESLRQHAKKCLIQELAQHPTPYGYFCLSSVLLPGEPVMLHGLGRVSAVEILIHVISLDPKYAWTYSTLACHLQPNGKVTLQGGKQMDRVELALEALFLESNNYMRYHNLAMILAPNESARIPDGTIMGKQQLLIRALYLRPSSKTAATSLAETLSDGTAVRLENGTIMTKEMLMQVGTTGLQGYTSYSSSYQANRWS